MSGTLSPPAYSQPPVSLAPPSLQGPAPIIWPAALPAPPTPATVSPSGGLSLATMQMTNLSQPTPQPFAIPRAQPTVTFPASGLIDLAALTGGYAVGALTADPLAGMLTAAGITTLGYYQQAGGYIPPYDPNAGALIPPIDPVNLNNGTQ